ncbi:hypothetical protein PTKIN_Ptkin16aG0542100 [Pterospermum kingtungense]
MELSFEVEAVIEFLRKYGLKEAEKALEKDMMGNTEEEEEEGAFDFEKFLFPMPPPVRIQANLRRSDVDEKVKSSDGSDSDFVNPYGLDSTSEADDSDTSSDRLSRFGTARDDPDFDMRNDFNWYDDKDEDHFMTPCFAGSDPYGCPSEDYKFVTTSVTEKQHEDTLTSRNKSKSIDYLEKQCIFNMPCINRENEVQVMDCYDHFDECDGFEAESDQEYLKNCDYGCELPLYSAKRGYNDSIKGFKGYSDLVFNTAEEVVEDDENNGEPNEHKAALDVNGDATDEDEYEVFNLRIIHRKNRTGFEENKDLPMVLNTVIAGRYSVKEHLGSASSSKVVQAYDLLMGVDVCLKIIKNDKDFFDQSLDEIKLLKLVNKYDPGDKCHILRLYDYFYHQEHLFIVCELLGPNLYEFRKFNQESGGGEYFTLSRLQVITRQCLEALDYLHDLGIIHCDLKPENILVKSYGRCEIKIIDLGSSCFLTDNLCLYVQSRSYRAPEVILGLPYDQKIDLWSLGCILAELYSGEVLFPNDAVVTILARMVGMLGPFDPEMLENGQETHKYFTKEYDLYHIIKEMNQLEYIFHEESSLEHHLQVSDARFIEFVRYLLQMNPRMRPTAKEALEHPWLSYSY